MENKYYTPEISEFHVGFEYDTILESNDWGQIPKELEGSWHRCIQSEEDFINYYEASSNLSDKLSSNKIRIKYLDQEDIESLGFKQDKDKVYRIIINDVEYVLLPLSFTNTNTIQIFRIDRYDTGTSRNVTLFIGNIKNKSELVRLLKQLEITIDK